MNACDRPDARLSEPFAAPLADLPHLIVGPNAVTAKVDSEVRLEYGAKSGVGERYTPTADV